LKEKHDEVSRYKKIVKELEDEIESHKIEIHRSLEKDREFILNIEKLEKNLIKELNDEQRKLATLVPGLAPKLTNYSK
jgi:predicted RNase H-like nuclease (RuvC/YqgF family)